jgi:hypothetical protein
VGSEHAHVGAVGEVADDRRADGVTSMAGEVLADSRRSNGPASPMAEGDASYQENVGWLTLGVQLSHRTSGGDEQEVSLISPPQADGAGAPSRPSMVIEWVREVRRRDDNLREQEHHEHKCLGGPQHRVRSTRSRRQASNDCKRCKRA